MGENAANCVPPLLIQERGTGGEVHTPIILGGEVQGIKI